MAYMPLVYFCAHVSAIAAYLQLWQEILDLPKPFQRCNHPSPPVSQTLEIHWPKTWGILAYLNRAFPKTGALIRM